MEWASRIVSVILHRNIYGNYVKKERIEYQAIKAVFSFGFFGKAFCVRFGAMHISKNHKRNASRLVLCFYRIDMCIFNRHGSENVHDRKKRETVTFYISFARGYIQKRKDQCVKNVIRLVVSGVLCVGQVSYQAIKPARGKK